MARWPAFRAAFISAFDSYSGALGFRRKLAALSLLDLVPQVGIFMEVYG
jgi:hypothetical protein